MCGLSSRVAALISLVDHPAGEEWQSEYYVSRKGSVLNMPGSLILRTGQAVDFARRCYNLPCRGNSAIFRLPRCLTAQGRSARPTLRRQGKGLFIARATSIHSSNVKDSGLRLSLSVRASMGRESHTAESTAGLARNASRQIQATGKGHRRQQHDHHQSGSLHRSSGIQVRAWKSKQAAQPHSRRARKQKESLILN